MLLRRSGHPRALLAHDGRQRHTALWPIAPTYRNQMRPPYRYKIKKELPQGAPKVAGVGEGEVGALPLCLLYYIKEAKLSFFSVLEYGPSCITFHMHVAI